MHGCLASQPIFDLKKNIFGYELLYRADRNSTEYDAVDGNAATREVILTAFSEIGIERVTGGRKAFINFTTELILDEVPDMLSNDVLVIELLEDIKPTEQILAVCRKLRRKGYLIALDDYRYSGETERLLEVADIVKIDFLQYDEKEIREITRKIKKKNRRKIFLAEKVETYSDYEMAISLGFSLFQGFFFCKPVVKRSKHISTLSASRLQLIGVTADPDINFDALANIIKPDVVLSYRLLKIVNSAYYGLRYSVKGISHALVILGQKETKKWLSFVILEEVIGEKPNELMRAALIRGFFMENISIQKRDKNNRDEYFLIGLFSLSDAIMDASLRSILRETHLSREICEPLLTRRGDRADYLKIIRHIERAEWDEANEIAQKYGLDQDVVNSCYLKAIYDANRLMQ